MQTGRYLEGEAEEGLGSLYMQQATRNAAWPVLPPSSGVSFSPWRLFIIIFVPLLAPAQRRV